jgi:hypothetical protein
MKSDGEIWQLFYDSTFVGDVMRYSTLLEFALNAVIAQYYIRSDRYEEAMEDLLPELSFGKKLDLLTHLPIRKKLSSYQKAISGIRQFLKIRNIVAHNPSISQSRVKQLSKDDSCKKILQEYPEGMKEVYYLTSIALSRLLKVRELRNPQNNEVIDSMSISFLKWIS